MIDYIDDAMYEWGIQRRRIDSGGQVRKRPDGSEYYHIDGWPDRSIAGKTRDDGMGASHSAAAQFYPEVLTGDALRVSRALWGAPERLRKVAYAHYVIPKRQCPIKAKVDALGYGSRKAYYVDLAAAQVWVAARWDVPRETECAHAVPTTAR